MDLQSFEERRESSTKDLRDYVEEEVREHYKDFKRRWIVPPEVLEQGYLLSQNIPEGHALVLKAEPETEEA